MGELFSVGATGKASLVCASDTPAVPDSQILKDGETIKGKGWQCTASGDFSYLLKPRKTRF